MKRVLVAGLALAIALLTLPDIVAGEEADAPSFAADPRVSDAGAGGVIHPAFAYRRDTGTWQWLIDVEKGGKRSSFARVALTRR